MRHRPTTARRVRRSSAAGQARRPAPIASAAGHAWERLLAWPALDGVLAPLLRHPYPLLGSLAVVGVLLAGWPLIGLVQRMEPMTPVPPVIAPARTPLPVLPNADAELARAMATMPTLTGPKEDAAAALLVVTAYNQASSTAGATADASLLARYVAPNSVAWQAIEAEYARRVQQQETHETALREWGVREMAVVGDLAHIETVERWDDLTRVQGQVQSSRRGIITHNRYTLARIAGVWRIVDVQSTTYVS